MEHYVYRAVLSSSPSLSHHGIKNQKWGVRRFQNPDGTLTPEGRKRYGVGERGANTHFKKSDVYAMEGAKRGGLLGTAVGKAVGVYKERKERKQDPNGLAKDERKVFDDAKKYEENAIYDFSVNSRSKPLTQRVKDTEEQLQKICDAHVKKLSDVMKSIPGQNPYDDVDSLYDGGFAQELATRINERFDVDGILDQHMDEYVQDYREGLISKKEFKQHYETELNDYAAWVVDTYTLDDLKKVAKTFTDSEGYEPGEYGDSSPKTGWKDYLKRVDSWEGVDSISMNRQNSKEPSGRYKTGSKDTVNAIGLPKGVELPGNWKNMSSAEKGAWMNSFTDAVINGKSSGRYKTGSKDTESKPDSNYWKDLGGGQYSPTSNNTKQPSGKYVRVSNKNGSGKSMVRIDDKSSAAVTLGYMGYSRSEIAKILGISEETLSKELASYKGKSYNGGIGVGRVKRS